MISREATDYCFFLRIAGSSSLLEELEAKLSAVCAIPDWTVNRRGSLTGLLAGGEQDWTVLLDIAKQRIHETEPILAEAAALGCELTLDVTVHPPLGKEDDIRTSVIGFGVDFLALLQQNAIFLEITLRT